MSRFRVHFEDGTKLEVEADDPSGARSAAMKRHRGRITKIKEAKGPSVAPRARFGRGHLWPDGIDEDARDGSD